MMWWADDWGWGAWLPMSLMMLASVALIVWACVLLPHSTGHDRRTSGEDILAERFARGEIDEGEYQHRRELIRTGRRSSDS